MSFVSCFQLSSELLQMNACLLAVEDSKYPWMLDMWPELSLKRSYCLSVNL